MAVDIEVPEPDVASGLTLANARHADPPIVVHVADERQTDAFARVEYRNRWYWIASGDFRSKLAFAVVQLLGNLVDSKERAGAVVTVPPR